jgi:uncharacterized membrane protein YccC
VIGAGIVDGLRRRDPGYRNCRRAARLALITLGSYYVFLYGFGNEVAATYAVFGVIAAGVFMRLPGSARRRSKTLLLTLPPGLALIAAGTALDSMTWAAVGGTLVIGFVVAFSGVGGPRLVGVAAGLLLFYIVANFPAHHTGALVDRLIGATVGMVIAAVAELVLWRDPTPTSYQQRLAEAAEAVAALLEASAEVADGRAPADGVLVRCREQAAAATERTRMVGFARTERPTSAGRRDRALRDAAAATREIAEQVQRVVQRPELRRGPHADAAALIRQCAAAVRRAARTLVDGTPPAEGGEEFPPAGPRPESGVPVGSQPSDLDRLWLLTNLWSMVEHVRILDIASRLAMGQRVRFEDGRAPGGSGAFWYARHSQISLYWRRVRVHLTPGSVYFQGALRLAVALAVTRAVAGELRLSHGFWALLGTLTVMRTSAVNTRSSLVSAVVGTALGAIVAGLLLRFTHGAVAHAVEFTLATVLAYALGLLLGLAWAQATLTVMITLVFAQLAPADWTLAGVRFMDVLLGGLVGIAAGMVIWPRGAGGELRERVSAYLRVDAELIGETVAALVTPDRHQQLPRALHEGRRELILADASLCQYYLERPDPRMERVHWDATMVAGHHVVHGAELLLYHNPQGCLESWPEAATALTDAAEQLRHGYRDVAEDLRDGRIDRPVATPADGAAMGARVTDIVAGKGNRPQDVLLVEVAGWLADLSENLDGIQAASGVPPRGPA